MLQRLIVVGLLIVKFHLMNNIQLLINTQRQDILA